MILDGEPVRKQEIAMFAVLILIAIGLVVALVIIVRENDLSAKACRAKGQEYVLKERTCVKGPIEATG